MNVITAYNVARFLSKAETRDSSWKLEEHGPQFLSYNWLLQALNRQDDVRETIRDMVDLGLLVTTGAGAPGSMKKAALTESGRRFLANFEAPALIQAALVDPKVWFDFMTRCLMYEKDVPTELAKILGRYRVEKAA